MSQPSEAPIARSIAVVDYVIRQLNDICRAATLEFALAVVDHDSEIGEKLKAGRALTEYELHLMIDVLLLHVRLGSRKLDLPQCA